MGDLIHRPLDEERLREALSEAPVVLLTGPRQAGKSTLAKAVVGPGASAHFDLEDPRDLSRLSEPTLALSALDATVVLDEAQRMPELFPVLRVLVDEAPRPGRFLVLGSASPELVGLAAESLAGRVRLIELAGLRGGDVAAAEDRKLWVRGGLPRSFTAASEGASGRWRDDYIATFLERDLANLGVRVPAVTMRRFWTMLAHYHAQRWNGAELARALAVSEPTVRRYLDALTDALVIRQLQPWFVNISKRQVRAPKVYVRDSGLLHRLLGLEDHDELLSHPKVGASWEGFVVEQLATRPEVRAAWHWATHGGAEIDLLLEIGSDLVGIEIKLTDRPKLTPSMRNALVELDLARLVVVHAGTERFPLGDRVEAVPAQQAIRGRF